MHRVDLVIAAAHPIELGALAPALALDAPCELHGRNIVAASVGVGMTLAGAGAMRVVLEYAPRALILIGSYGRYPSATARPFVAGELLVPDRVRAVDHGVLEGRAAFPDPMPSACEADAELVRGLCRQAAVASGTLATTLGITTDDALAYAIGTRSGCEGENLEAIAVAAACAAVGIRFAGIFGCTNLVGSQGRTQWREHHPLAARNTAALVLRWLALGAPGL